MPVFGKGRASAKRQSSLRSYVGREAFEKSNQVHYGPKDRFLLEGSSLRKVRGYFRGLFGDNDFIQQRYAQSGKPVVVLDWGCGQGQAIEEVGKHFGERVRAYGFSKDSHKEWKRATHAKLILNTADRMLRYFKPGSIDLIYSHFGLYHYHPAPYLVKLVTRLKPGGKIVFNLDSGKQYQEMVRKLLPILGNLPVTIQCNRLVVEITNQKKNE